MARASKCTVCAHEARAKAEAAVVSGVSVRAAAKQFAIPYQSLDRHIRNCVPESVALAHQSREVVLGGKVLDRIEQLQLVTDEILQVARQSDAELALKAIAQARRNLELIGRLTGELNPEQQEQRGTVTLEEFEALLVRVRTTTIREHTK